MITWEVWLRRAREGEAATQQVLAAAQEDFGYEVISEPLKFVDRTVVLVRATPEQLALGTDFLGRDRRASQSQGHSRIFRRPSCR